MHLKKLKGREWTLNFKMSCVWLLMVVINVVGVNSQTTLNPLNNDVSVTASTIPTVQPTTHVTDKSTSGTLEALHAEESVEKQDKFHHCTACPFESDHHQCNDPFMLSKKFEVSSDMCNAINAEKTQVERLCKRYPKGYFFQCPKDGSSYTCKASCGVQVEDVGKGLLDADITDMPGGLLSGMGLAGNKINAHGQNNGFNILGGMGDLLHPQAQQTSDQVSPFNPFGNINAQPHQFASNQFQHPNNMQFGLPGQNQFENRQQSPVFHGQLNKPQPQHYGYHRNSNFGREMNQFAGPHKSYPGPNPMFNNNNAMFDNHLLSFPQRQFNNGLHQHRPRLMFENSPQINRQQQQPANSHVILNNPVPSRPIQEVPSQSGVFFGPSQSPKEISQPIAVRPKSQSQPLTTLPTDVPKETAAPVASNQVQNQTPMDKTQPTASVPETPAPVALAPVEDASESQGSPVINQQVPTNAPQVNRILHLRDTQPKINPSHNDRITANHPMNIFGEFHPIVDQSSSFPQVRRHQPLHPYGGNGFMLNPVQQSASQATSNYNNFMGGFDDFNTGFHGFAAGIGGGQGHAKNKPRDNQGHFNNFNNIFGFRRRR